jgi:hypothetical protein
MAGCKDPGKGQGNGGERADVYGNDGEQVGTIEKDWWHTDGQKTWTDNDGGEHQFTVDNDHW